MSIFNYRFSNRSAYLAIRDEEDRIRLFHAFVAKQQDRSSVDKDKDKASSSRKKNKRDKEKRDHERERDREDGKSSDKKKRTGSPVAEELSKG